MSTVEELPVWTAATGIPPPPDVGDGQQLPVWSPETGIPPPPDWEPAGKTTGPSPLETAATGVIAAQDMVGQAMGWNGRGQITEKTGEALEKTPPEASVPVGIQASSNLQGGMTSGEQASALGIKAVEAMSSLGDRRKLLGVLRSVPKKQRDEFLVEAARISRSEGERRPGLPTRVGQAVSVGVAGIAQPIMELAGIGGTDEEIAIIRQLEGIRQGTFAPSIPTDPWYDKAIVRAAGMTPAAIEMASGGGAAGKLAMKAAWGAKGVRFGKAVVTAARSAGIAATAYPSAYVQELTALRDDKVDDRFGKPIAALSAVVQGLLESIIPNPFSPGRQAVVSGARKAATRYLLGIARNYPGEITEEVAQGFVSGMGQAIGTYLDETAPDLGITKPFTEAWDQGTQALLPMAVMIGAPAAVGAGAAARRGARAAKSEEIAKLASLGLNPSRTQYAKATGLRRNEAPAAQVRTDDVVKARQIAMRVPESTEDAQAELAALENSSQGTPEQTGRILDPVEESRAGFLRKWIEFNQQPKAQEPPNAETVHSIEAPVRSDESGQDFRRTGEEQGPAQPAGEVPEAQIAAPGSPSPPYGISHRAIDAIRLQQGFPARTNAEPFTDEQAFNEAMAASPQQVHEAITRIGAGEGRGKLDNAMMLRRTVELGNQIEAANARGDKAAARSANDELARVVEANTVGGRKAGRELQSRKMFADSDMSLVAITTKEIEANEGQPLSDERLAKAAELAKAHADLQAKYDALEEKYRQERLAAADKAVEQEVTAKQQKKVRVTRTAESKERLKDAFQKYMATFAGTGEKGSVEFTSDRFKAAVELVKAAADYGVKRLSEFLAEAKEAMGERFQERREDLEAAWKHLRERGELSITMPEVPDRSDPANRRLWGALMGREARKLHREFVEAGVQDRESRLDAVWEELKQLDPEITRREAADAMSGFGDFKELAKDEVSIIVRKDKGELQQLSKIDNLNKAIAKIKEWKAQGIPDEEISQRLAADPILPKTGMERRTPSADERDYIKEVNKLKKDLPVQPMADDRQLQTSFATAERTILNRMEALRNAIKNERPIPEGGEPKWTAEQQARLDSLRAELDTLTRDYRKLFPTKTQRARMERKADQAAMAEMENEGGITDMRSEQQRILALAKTLDGIAKRKAADLARLKQEGWKAQPKSKKLTSPLIETKQAEIDAIDAQRDELLKLDPAYQENLRDKALQARVQGVDREIAKLEEDLAAGRLMPEQQAEAPTSPELEQKQARLEELKAQRETLRKEDPSYQQYLEERSNASYRRALATRLARNRAALAEMKATRKLPEKKPPRALTDEQVELKQQMAAVRRETMAEVESIRRENLNLGQRMAEDFGEVASVLPKAVMASSEMSAVGKQGFFYMFSHPLRGSRMAVRSIKAAFSERIELAQDEDLAQRPNAKSGDYLKADIDVIPKDGPLSMRSELFRSRIIDWLAASEGKLTLPGRVPAKIIIASERSFRSFCNGMQADQYDILKETTLRWRRWIYGDDAQLWNDNDCKVIGRAANILSAKGTGLKGGGGLNYLLWAPRYAWALVQTEFVIPFQLMTPKAIGQWKGDAATRLALAEQYVRMALGVSAFGAANFLLYDILSDDWKHRPKMETNVLSSEFMKQRVGRVRISVGSGFPQLVTLAARLITGKTKTSSGEIRSISGPDIKYGQDDAAEIVIRYLRQKLGPAFSGALDWFSGRNAMGQPRTTTQIIGERLMPMTWRDIYDAEKELGVMQGTVAAIEAFFGLSVNTYEDRKPNK